MNPSEDPSDRLVDSLLREQSRGKADEALLKSIDEKLDGVPLVQRRSDERRLRLWMPLSAAAAFVLGAIGSYMWQMHSESELSRMSGAPVVDMASAPDRKTVVPEPEAKDLARANASVEAAPSAPRVAAAGETALAAMPDSSIQSDSFEPVNPLLQPLEGNAPGDGSGGPGSVGGKGTGSGIAGGGRAMAEAPAANPAPSKAPELAMRKSDQVKPADSFGRAAGGFVLPAEEPLDEAQSLALEIREKEDKRRTRHDDGFSRENYGRLVDQPWKSPWQEALSTFSIDVDNASYTNLRRMIQEGRTIPADAVRIEECLNYFDYHYEGPKGDGPFAVHGDLATCPWKPGHLLARVAIKGKEIPNNARPASNLVFLVDVSGSMQSPDKLPLLKRSMRVLIDQLDERDRVGMVVYAGTEGVVLEPTLLDERGKSRAIQALEKLEAGGSTNGGAGIKRAYELAAKHMIQGGTNRVILATDGDFNVGTTGQGDLVNLVKNGSGNRIYLSVLGFGTGNLNDAMLEAITKDGNGNYFYVDNDGEARRVFLQKLSGTLVTIAKDVKIQVEFNPGKVKAYRLIGYANRILRHEDFNNDTVDAGDIGAGHTVTAFYEIVPDGVAMPDTGVVDPLRYQRPAGKEVVASEDWFTLKLRHKHPEGDTSSLIETPVRGEASAWQQAGNDFRFASAVALFGMKLRQMPDVAGVPWSRVEAIAKPALAEDPQEQRSEFIGMVRKIGGYDPSQVAVDAVEAPVGDAVALSDLSYVGMRSVKWYVQFGLEGNGGWAPKLLGQGYDKKHFSNRVGAAKMIRPGDRFFADGEMAGRFQFIGFTEKEVTGRRTNLSQNVKVAIYEDLKPGKAGKRYESQYGLPDAEIDAAAYLDHSAVFDVRGPANKELVVEEGSRFGGAEGVGGLSFLLKEVTPDHVVVEYADENGVLTTVTISMTGK